MPPESWTSARTRMLAAPAASAGGTEIRAPLAGSIIDVLVSVGDSVNDGDPVMIVEAMKMETEIRATGGGSVQSIAVSKGEAIAADQLLMTIG